MRIISWNVNGLRSVHRKGFLDWLEKTDADIVCLQEIKAHKKDLPANLIKPLNYHAYFNCASKKGYSGVLVYSKRKALAVKRKIGFKRFDNEGRFLELRFADFVLLNLYLPHGGRGKENLAYKLECYRYLFNYLEKIRSKKKILIGDFNIAHKEIDLARPKQNKNNIMFTPEERKQLDRLIRLGFVDTFRKFHKSGGHYTWWVYGFNAKKRNIGWRLDYAFIANKLTSKLKDAFILREVDISDHCPIGLELNF